jgi:lysophospholipase L1-like esterase
VIASKISVYGDSTCISQQGSATRAARIAAFGPGFSGHNDYAQGGNSLARNLTGNNAGKLLFGGLTFQQHIRTADDAGIVVIHLGGNDQPQAMNGSLIPPGAPAEAYLGSDGLQIAADALLTCQYAKEAGKRVLVCGTPYYDAALAATALVPDAGPDGARGFINRLNIVNTALRCASSVADVPFVATYGAPVRPDQPRAGHASTWDGLHPTRGYSHAVSDFIASEIIRIFRL